jgi:hypothetical protein
MAETPPPVPPDDELTDRELLLRLHRMGQHLDILVHESHQMITDIHGWARQAAPLLEQVGHSRAAALFTRQAARQAAARQARGGGNRAG